MIVKCMSCLTFVRLRNVITLCSGNFCKSRIFVSSSGDQCHIMSRCIMILLPQSVCIGKMSTGTSKFFCPVVHHFYIVVCTARNMLRYTVACLVGGHKQNGIQAFFHGDLFALFQLDIRSSALQLQCLGRVGNHLIQRRVFNCQHSRHNLGNTSRILLLVHIFLIQNGS